MIVYWKRVKEFWKRKSSRLKVKSSFYPSISGVLFHCRTCALSHIPVVSYLTYIYCILVGSAAHIVLSECHLTHWGRVTHKCVGNLTIIGSDNGLSPGRRQAIIWTNVRILLFGPLETNCSEIWIEVNIVSYMKMHWKISSVKLRTICLGLNVISRSVGPMVTTWTKWTTYIKWYFKWRIRI